MIIRLSLFSLSHNFIFAQETHQPLTCQYPKQTAHLATNSAAFGCHTEGRLSFNIIIGDFSQAINSGGRHQPANYPHKSIEHNLHVYK